MALCAAVRCNFYPNVRSLSIVVPKRRSWNKVSRCTTPSLHTSSFKTAGVGAGALSGLSVRAMSSGTDLKEMIKTKNSENPVIVYSKSWCPYCSEVKGLFKKLGVAYKVIELDELADGDSVQAALAGVTGRRTVPQVFIAGSFVGGCDDTMAAYSSGKLKELFSSAGVTANL